MVGRIENSISDSSEAIRLDSKCTVALCNRALAYDRKGNYQRAIADLDSALRIEPGSFYCLELRASYRIKSGDYDKGMADLRSAISMCGDDPARKFENWRKEPLGSDAIRRGSSSYAKCFATGR